MMTRVEEQYYNNIGRIARAMERIAAALEFEAGMRTFKDSGADVESKLTAAGIGRRIKERLNELGMTKHELAIACGIDDKKTGMESAMWDKLIRVWEGGQNE